MEGGRARKSHSKLTHSRDLGDAWKGIAKPVKISVFFKALPPQQNSSPAVLDSPSQPSSTECPLPRSCMACAYLTGPVRPFLPSPRTEPSSECPASSPLGLSRRCVLSSQTVVSCRVGAAPCSSWRLPHPRCMKGTETGSVLLLRDSVKGMSRLSPLGTEGVSAYFWVGETALTMVLNA